MSLTHTFSVGRFTCHLLDAGRQRLDGGAMFGVVPKPLWERRIRPDEKNRIPLALRCLLVEHDDGLVLIDTGIGNKETAKFHSIYGVENAGTHGPTRLDDALVELGFSVDDVRIVINTHLHFDHAGGNTVGSGDGTPDDREVRAAFPRAEYVTQKRELDFAMHTNERTAASYLSPNFEPIARAGKWRLVDGEREIVPGIRVIPTPGHVPFHQSVIVADGEETLCFVADLVPTTAHVPLPWIMGYDLEPMVTLETKRRVLGRAAEESWLMVFEHEPAEGVGRIVKDDKSFAFAPLA